jgi:hypothetical protein
MNTRLFKMGITLWVIGSVFGLLLAKASGQQQPQFAQPQQQPQYPYQYQQPRPQQQFPQPGQQQQQIPQQPYQIPTQQYPPTAQFRPQQPPAGFGQLMNESQVITCLNRVLDDSIMRGSSLTIQNNMNHTVSLGLKQSFIINATNTLDACILPRR